MIADDAVRPSDATDRSGSGQAASCLVDLLMRDAQKAGKFGVLQGPALLDQAEHVGLGRHDFQHGCKHRVLVQHSARDATSRPPSEGSSVSYTHLTLPT